LAERFSPSTKKKSSTLITIFMEIEIKCSQYKDSCGPRSTTICSKSRVQEKLPIPGSSFPREQYVQIQLHGS
jgi:hypothetical protein